MEGNNTVPFIYPKNAAISIIFHNYAFLLDFSLTSINLFCNITGLELRKPERSKDMQVILKEDVEKLGQMGQIVEVKRGYARNFLIPKDIALEATPNNLKQLEHQKRLVSSRIKKVQKASETAADKLNQTTVKLFHLAGEEEKLFGAVTTMEIADALKEQGIEIDKRKIVMDEPIKRLGEYQVVVKLPASVTASVKVIVAAKEQ